MGVFATFRRRWQRLAVASVAFCLIAFSILSNRGEQFFTPEQYAEAQPEFSSPTPLIWKHINSSTVRGGGTFSHWLGEMQADLQFSSSFLDPPRVAPAVDAQADDNDRSGASCVPIDKYQQYHAPNEEHRDPPGGTPNVEEYASRHMAGLDSRQCRAMDGDGDGNTDGLLFME